VTVTRSTAIFWSLLAWPVLGSLDLPPRSGQRRTTRWPQHISQLSWRVPFAAALPWALKLTK